MRQSSSPRYRLPGVRSTMAALLTAGGLALAIVPTPAWAASNEAHLDRQVLKAMQAGQSIHVIVVARGDLNVLQADLRRTGLKHTVRVPIAHGIAVELTPALIDHFPIDANVARLVYDAPVRLSDTPFNPPVFATAHPTVAYAVTAWTNPAPPSTGHGTGGASQA